MTKLLSRFPFLAVVALTLAMAACVSDSEIVLRDGPPGVAGSRFSDPDVVVELTASVFDWEVIPGETVTVWGYNQQYPGPTINATRGDKVRVTVHNELPEATTIHWHGFDVPWDQDGVDGLAQPAIQPGETWVYEFVATDAGTHMYHSHTNSMEQVQRGLIGALIIHPKRDARGYDHEYVFALHEIEGWFTINGKSFPATMANDMMLVKTGDKILIRMFNAGQVNHPMHLHGHQFRIVAIDGNDIDFKLVQNTYDIAPGMVVDVEIIADNPGTWMFHCHTLPHTTNRGVYPGGMVLMMDYTDHTSYFDEQVASGGDTGGHDPDTTPIPAGEVVKVSGSVEIVATDFAFDLPQFRVDAGQPLEITLRNAGVAIHNLTFKDAPYSSFKVELNAGQRDTASITFTEPGEYDFYCDIPGHENLGMSGTVYVE